MQTRHDTPPLAPLSAEDTSLGRLRWIVALALTGLVVIGAAAQLGITKLRSAEQPSSATAAATSPAQSR